MITIHSFVFSPFQENTYVLFDETKECVVIDPGCYHSEERDELANFIEINKLKPVRLLNTHCHIDHVMGNKFVADRYHLKLEINEHDLPTLKAMMQVAAMYGLEVEESPSPQIFLDEKDMVKFGTSSFTIFFTPGHSRGSICFVNEPQKFVIAGDVLFKESIGRTDLPGGDYKTLVDSIKNKLFTLSDEYLVYPGHGSFTTIGHEKKNNPFLINL